MKVKQQWLRGWIRQKVRAGEIPGWVQDCLGEMVPGEIPAPEGCSVSKEAVRLTWISPLGARLTISQNFSLIASGTVGFFVIDGYSDGFFFCSFRHMSEIGLVWAKAAEEVG